jgi:acetyl-CoA carboxylase biotin carboxyl carrier protein
MAKLTVDAEVIRALAALLEETGLSEIEIADGRRQVRVVRAARARDAEDLPRRREPTPTAGANEPPEGAVTSPMVGVAYLSPEPGAPPFVKVGDQVAEGQTLLVVEAMKVMNPIRSPRAGRVSRVAIGQGQPVEFGDVLMVLG